MASDDNYFHLGSAGDPANREAPDPEELTELREAAYAIYEAGRWALVSFAEGEEGFLVVTPEEQDAMWARLRDALGLPLGEKTETGANHPGSFRALDL